MNYLKANSSVIKKAPLTGAIRDRIGRFELADGGTIFLDEVGEIPLNLQGKLLRVLQEGQLERVGESRTCTVDVRVITATNRDLKIEVEENRFREDLYFRLNVFPIEAVPLRQRGDDIPLLAQHFITLISQNNKMKFDLPGLEQTGLELPRNAPTITQVQHSDNNGLAGESSGQQPYIEDERLASDRENIRHALAVYRVKSPATMVLPGY